MNAIVTVIGQDKVGIIAGVSSLLAAHGVNILDINQTILQNFFTMVMVVSLDTSDASLPQLQKELAAYDEHLEIRIQSEEIFSSMHRL